MKSLPLTLDGLSSRPIGWQVARRVEFVVQTIVNTHRGRSEAEIAEVLVQKLRGLGVNPIPKNVQRMAEAIAALPPGAAISRS